jgi:uncharacterized protein DUF6515
MSSARTISINRPVAMKAAFAALFALSCMAAMPRFVHAEPGGYHGHEFREHEFRHDEFRDTRFHHDHYYPPRGYRFAALPPNPRVIVRGRDRFYFAGGVWYQPLGGAYVVVRPPIGVYVPVLPAYYTRVWVGPRPYYYANDVYYVQGPQGYTVVDPPVGAISMAPPPGVTVPPDNAVTELGAVQNGVPQYAPPPVSVAPPVSAAPPVAVAPPVTVAQASNQLFIYPRQGQNADQQNRDRSECSSWASSQTGRDPASSGGDPDYQRALGACLDGRGYTVK